jgi:hypothetical protein
VNSQIHQAPFRPALTSSARSFGGVESTIEVHIYSNVGHTELTCTLTIKGQLGKMTNKISNEAGLPDDVKLETNISHLK